MFGAWCLESPLEGRRHRGGGLARHIEGEESSCRALRTQTCDCCLYLREQKGVDVVKGKRQSRLKYSVDSCRGGDSAHCGGPACDVSGEGSAQRGLRPVMCVPSSMLEAYSQVATQSRPYPLRNKSKGYSKLSWWCVICLIKQLEWRWSAYCDFPNITENKTNTPAHAI